jgi:Heparinase II/III-like protein/Heparinase II/III N-terminus
MNVGAAVTRLAAMDREEARFRLVCAARKVAGRVQCAVRPPRWDRSDILRVLDPSSAPLVARAWDAAKRHDYGAAHRALASHFRTRASRWPLQASRRNGLADEIRQCFPDAARHARDAADRLLDGRHDLLGYRDVPLGNPPDWHADVIHQRNVPLEHWAAVPYLDPAVGDHKIIWETSRHQYWLTLGRGYWLTADRRYRTAFIAHLEDWLQQNPPLRGAHWASMLELAFRAMSWTWAVEFFSDCDAEGDDTPWLVDLLIALDRQLTHIAQNLSTYFSPNTHLSGEGLALYVVSLAFPELRRNRVRASTGRSILLAQATKQVRGDGGHAERSAHYHRYSTDFYLLALTMARASGDAAAEPLEHTARRQAAFLRTLADDQGRLPRIGDDDGGQLFRFGSGATSDASATLSVAATLFDDRSFAVRPPSEEVYWILGRPPEIAISVNQAARWPSRCFPDSGYLVSRTDDGGHLVFDAGPHGFLNGGHAHSDALSVVLSVADEPLLVDPGTATYTMDAAVRDRFRASRMHNTLILDGRDHAEPHGPFHWRSRADARFLVARTTPDGDFAVGTHDAYGPGRHMRAVLTLPEFGWLIVDRVLTNRPAEAETWWHLHPAWRAVVQDSTVWLRHASGRHLGLATTAEDIAVIDDPQIASVSLEYGRIEPATTLRGRHRAAEPFVIGTFVPASAALSDGLAMVEVPAETPADARWTACAFAIHAGGIDRRVQLVFPSDPEAQPASGEWPQPCITPSPRHQMAATTHQ